MKCISPYYSDFVWNLLADLLLHSHYINESAKEARGAKKKK